MTIIELYCVLILFAYDVCQMSNMSDRVYLTCTSKLGVEIEEN